MFQAIEAGAVNRSLILPYLEAHPWYNRDSAKKMGHCLVNISLNSKMVIVKRCTPLRPKMHTPQTFR